MYVYFNLLAQQRKLFYSFSRKSRRSAIIFRSVAEKLKFRLVVSRNLGLNELIVATQVRGAGLRGEYYAVPVSEVRTYFDTDFQWLSIPVLVIVTSFFRVRLLMSLLCRRGTHWWRVWPGLLLVNVVCFCICVTLASRSHILVVDCVSSHKILCSCQS